MNAEIICVGTELLLGDILNTNAQYIARELSALGISVYNQQVVGDNPARLRQAARLARDRSDIVIYSGGLGPTEDDLTKQTVASVYNDDLVFNQEICDGIEEFFRRSGRIMTENNRRQAYVPKRGQYIPNGHGTAPGIIFHDGEKLAILLPGVPREMEHMMTESVVPMLSKLVNGSIKSRYVHVIGVGESSLEDMISDLLDASNPTVALYAKEGEVQVRITALASSREEAEELLDKAYRNLDARIHNYIYGVDVDSIEQVIVKTLKERGQKISTAESCTGGGLSSRITSIPGASDVLELGVCTYSDRQKSRMLDIPEDMLQTYTAVSSQVAVRMAQGIMRLTGSEYSVATTGYAGPTGGTEANPVGTVFISVATHDTTFVKRCSFTGTRRRITHLACQSAFDMLRCVMNDLPCEGVKVADVRAYAPASADDAGSGKKGGFLKGLLTFILLVALALAIAFGVLKAKYPDRFDFSKLLGNIDISAIADRMPWKKETKDIGRIIEERRTGDFFARGFEKDTQKMYSRLSAQDPDLKGWLTFKGAGEDHPVYLTENKGHVEGSLTAKESSSIPGYIYLEGFDEGNTFDYSDLKTMRQNSSFILFDDNGSRKHQIFAVGTFSGKELNDIKELTDRQEYIVRIRARSLFDIDTTVTDRDDLTALVKQVGNDEYLVAFARIGDIGTIPSVDVKLDTIYSEWYLNKTGLTNERAAQALLYAQEVYDRDNWYVSMEEILKEEEASSEAAVSSQPEGSSSSQTRSDYVSSSLYTGSTASTYSSSTSSRLTSSSAPVSSTTSSAGSQPSSSNTTPSSSREPASSASRANSRTSSSSNSINVVVEEDDEEILTVTMNGQVVSGPASKILAQIVAVEMTSTWHPEAIKAQAVATHSYLEFMYARGDPAPAVSGRSNPSHNIINNVATVHDQVMTYNGQPINASYTASVAGRTNPSSQVWSVNYPYLQSVESKYDYLTSGYEKTYTISLREMKRILSERVTRDLDDEDARNWFSVIDYTDGGYVRRMQIGNATTYVGSNGNTRNITGYYFASDIMASGGTPLRSAAFDITYADGYFTIVTRGYGHGVGLSQWGAEMYARQEGWTYDQILRHYYTGVSIVKK